MAEDNALFATYLNKIAHPPLPFRLSLNAFWQVIDSSKLNGISAEGSRVRAQRLVTSTFRPCCESFSAKARACSLVSNWPIRTR
jgi:hypothetical protein